MGGLTQQVDPCLWALFCSADFSRPSDSPPEQQEEEAGAGFPVQQSGASTALLVHFDDTFVGGLTQQLDIVSTTSLRGWLSWLPEQHDEVFDGVSLQPHPSLGGDTKCV